MKCAVCGKEAIALTRPLTSSDNDDTLSKLLGKGFGAGPEFHLGLCKSHLATYVKEGHEGIGKLIK